MRESRGFTIVELLVVILIIGILLAMTVPNFRNAREQARRAGMKMNLHNTQVVVETFHMEKGYYADDFYEDGYGSFFPGGVFNEEIGRLPTNPWSNQQMDPDEFNPEDYEKESDLSNNQEDGPNDIDGYSPGEVVYGVWEPEGAQAPVGYGLVAVGTNGISIREYDSDGNAIIFLLHN